MAPSASSGAGSGRPAWQRRAIARFALALALLVVGAVVVALADSHGTVELIGWMLVGLGLTLATVFTFLEIGLSEDREREGKR